jgi:hypothetical protein
MNRSDDDRQIETEELLAAEELDPSDFALLNSVRADYDEHDPVPDGLVDRIQFQLTLDALHTEVATLTQLDLATAGTRSATTEAVRTITFTSDSVTTMVTLTPLGDGSVRVDGWAAPGAGILVELLLPDGRRDTYADDDGRFVFEGVPSGLAKFALYVPHDTELFTVLSPAIEL